MLMRMVRWWAAGNQISWYRQYGDSPRSELGTDVDLLTVVLLTVKQVQPGDLFVCVERDGRDGHADAAEVGNHS